jgi:hypothetical protein
MSPRYARSLTIFMDVCRCMKECDEQPKGGFYNWAPQERSHRYGVGYFDDLNTNLEGFDTCLC